MTGKCPDHSAVRLGRVPGSEGVYVCPLDGKHYDFTNGYTKNNGERVHGGSISDQTPDFLGVNY